MDWDLTHTVSLIYARGTRRGGAQAVALRHRPVARRVVPSGEAAAVARIAESCALNAWPAQRSRRKMSASDPSGHRSWAAERLAQKYIPPALWSAGLVIDGPQRGCADALSARRI